MPFTHTHRKISGVIWERRNQQWLKEHDYRAKEGLEKAQKKKQKPEIQDIDHWRFWISQKRWVQLT